VSKKSAAWGKTDGGKKRAAYAAAQDPPKEEGGGDKTWSARVLQSRSARYGSKYRDLICAMQEKFGATPHHLLLAVLAITYKKSGAQQSSSGRERR
jgi:hypothetical protein